PRLLRPRPDGPAHLPGGVDAGVRDRRRRDPALRRVRGLTMDTPLEFPAAPAPLPWLWRAISSLGFLRRLVGIPEERAGASRPARAPASFDWDGPDTSLTQAELEVLK